MEVANCDTRVQLPGRAMHHANSDNHHERLTMFNRISKVIAYTLTSIEAAIMFNCDTHTN